MTKPKQYALPKRDMALASGANFRTEFHGDKPVKAADIAFSGWKLEPLEFCELVQEPLAHRALYVKRPGSVLDDPLLRTIGSIPLDITITGKVSLFSSTGRDEIDLGVCEIARLKFDCKTGGLTEFRGLIQTKPTLDKRVVELIDRLGDNVQMSVSYEHGPEQTEMPMGNATALGNTQANGHAPAPDASASAPQANSETPRAAAQPLGEIGPKTREEIAKAQTRGRKKGGARPGAH